MEILMKIDGNLETKSISVVEIIKFSYERLQELITKRISALWRIVKSAELAAASFDYSVIYDANDESCYKTIEGMNNADVKFFDEKKKISVTPKSGIHIAVESYRCENAVRRDFDWTSSERIEETFRENFKRDPTIESQFIGSNSGLTRIFPIRKWITEPEPITIDLFDPRFRQWFIAAQSAPKDILFLIDMSGSVKGQTVHLIRMTVLHILATLNPNDYINAIWFNSRQESVLRACFDGFIPATTRNKKILREQLNLIEEKDQANFNAALNLSFSFFNKGELDVISEMWKERLNIGSGGHKIIMVFTDGVEDWPSSILEFRRSSLQDNPVRIFGFAMGYGTGKIPILEYLACNTHATCATVDSIADVKRQSIAYISKLSEILSLAYSKIPPETRPVTWTPSYMDTQGGGPTVTMSMAILNAMENGSSLLGVAGIDVPFKHFAEILPENEQMYAFIVDNNGIAIYHPQLKIPKTEIYSVRRTACYDKRLKSRGNGRIQFGEADERVLKLMGLTDSIPTIDIAELELSSSKFLEFRKAMIDQNCNKLPFIDGTRHYYCRSISGTPWTIGFVVFSDRGETILTKNIPRPTAPTKALVGHYVPKRGLCRGNLDHENKLERFNAFLESEKCEMDKRLPYALASSLNKWTESWPDLEGNATCVNNPLPINFNPFFYINSFVSTLTHITAFYPECSFESLRSVIDLLELDRYPKPTNKLQIFVFNENRTHTVTAYEQIFDSKFGRRLALGGVQWTVSFIGQIFTNLTIHSNEWKVCYHRKKRCYLVTMNGFVVAGKQAEQHLSQSDPYLFNYLIKKSVVLKSYRRDNQAQCSPLRTYLLTKSDASTTNFHEISTLLHKFMEIFSSAFWFELWIVLSTLLRNIVSQPVMIGKICQFSRIKHRELCSLEYPVYEMELNHTKRFILNDGICSRDILIKPLQDISLYLFIVDNPCNNNFDSSVQHSHTFLPRRVSECERIRPLYRRRRPDLDYTRRHPQERNAPCSGSVNASLFWSFLFIFIFVKNLMP